MINPEQAPAQIFDWLENLSFNQLNEMQKQSVLLHFTVDDYEAMHRAAQAIKGLKQYPLVDDSVDTKTRLNLQYEKQYNNAKVIPVSSRHLLLWQAAAAVLFVLSGWMCYKLFDFKKADVSTQMARVDTVYVDREIKSPAEVIHDTVVMYKYLRASDKNENQSSTQKQEINQEYRVPITGSDIRVMRMDELENTQNKPRRKSMSDDSLLKKYNYIAL